MHRVSTKKSTQMDKFQNKYRIPSPRLQNWNYGSPGLYFITVCTKNREHYFEEIIIENVHSFSCGRDHCLFLKSKKKKIIILLF